MKVKLLTICVLAVTLVFGQSSTEALSSDKENSAIKHKHSIGASLFMIANFLPDSPDYYLFTYGYRLTKKDRLFVEFNTWKYTEPLGTYGHSKEFYPGYVRAFGLGVGYQRFHWKGLFTTLSATPFSKQYYDTENLKIENGFQLYLQLIAGYRFEFLEDRFFIEPAYALKYWPVDTNFPSEFSAIENGAPKYIFEPSLNIGFKF